MAERFDLIVIGAGPGGYVAAIRAAQLGHEGGLRREARPRSAAPASTSAASPARRCSTPARSTPRPRRHFGRHGIKVGEVEPRPAAMLARKDKVVKGLTDGVAYLFKKNKITVYRRHRPARRRRARSASSQSASTGRRTTRWRRRRSCWPPAASRRSLPSLPFDGKNVVSSTEALAFDRCRNTSSSSAAATSAWNWARSGRGSGRRSRSSSSCRASCR